MFDFIISVLKMKKDKETRNYIKLV